MSDVNPLPVAQAVAAPVGTLPIAPVVAVAPIAPVVAVAAAQPAYVQAPLGGVTQGGDVFNGDYSALVGTWEVEFLEMPPTGGASNFNMQITFAVNNGVLTGNTSIGFTCCGCCPLGPYTSQGSYEPSVSCMMWRDPQGFVTTDRWTSPTTFETTSNNPRGVQRGTSTLDWSRGVMSSESYVNGRKMVTRATKR